MKDKRRISAKDLAMVAATIYDGDAEKAVEDALAIYSICEEKLKVRHIGSPERDNATPHRQSAGFKLGKEVTALPDSFEKLVETSFAREQDRKDALVHLEKINDQFVDQEINPPPIPTFDFSEGSPAEMWEKLECDERCEDFEARRTKALQDGLKAMRAEATSKNRSAAMKELHAKKKAAEKRKVAKKKAKKKS